MDSNYRATEDAVEEIREKWKQRNNVSEWPLTEYIKENESEGSDLPLYKYVKENGSDGPEATKKRDEMIRRQAKNVRD